MIKFCKKQKGKTQNEICVIQALIFSDGRDFRDILLQILVVNEEIEAQRETGMPKLHS